MKISQLLKLCVQLRRSIKIINLHCCFAAYVGPKDKDTPLSNSHLVH